MEAADKPLWTLDEIVTQLTRPDAAWQRDSISYSFPTYAPGYDYGPERDGYSSLVQAQQQAALAAIQAWGDVIAVPFAEGSGWGSDITIANTTTGPDVGWASYPYGSTSGDVWIGPHESNAALGVGQYGLSTMLHEIGHALGLAHPADYSYDGTGDATDNYEEGAIYRQDSRQYTIMSYFGAESTGADHYGVARGDYSYAPVPLLHDIAAAQALYGANMGTRTGDTVYGFHTDAGEVYDFALYPDPVLALWDAGGTDTLDCSGYAVSQRLDLAEGGFSDVGGLAGNVAVAFGAEIENAIGGRAGDGIYGNALANRLEGLGGDDALAGFGGGDALYGGKGRDRLSGGLGADGLTGGDGRDRLEGDKGADALAGGGGADRLEGGKGRDALSGGAGNDVFVWRQGSGLDSIADSGGGADVLRLAGIASAEGLSWQQRGDDLVLLQGDAAIIRLLGHALPGSHVEWLELSGGDRHPLDLAALPGWLD